MKYLHEIFWYLTFPITIAVSYYAVLRMVKLFHKQTSAEQVDADEKKDVSSNA